MICYWFIRMSLMMHELLSTFCVRQTKEIAFKTIMMEYLLKLTFKQNHIK